MTITGDRIADTNGDAPIMGTMIVTGTGDAVTTSATIGIAAVVIVVMPIAISDATSGNWSAIVGDSVSTNASTTIEQLNASANGCAIGTATTGTTNKRPRETATTALWTGSNSPVQPGVRNTVQIKEGSPKWLPFFTGCISV